MVMAFARSERRFRVPRRRRVLSDPARKATRRLSPSAGFSLSASPADEPPADLGPTLAMARILYALSGQGRGHTSRGLAVAHGLRARGHEVSFCGGGTARTVLEALGEPVVPAPTLRQVMWRNRLMLITTGFRNVHLVWGSPVIVRRLTEQIEALAPDLIVSDFDRYAHRAAAHLDIPVVTLDHQQIVTEAPMVALPGNPFNAFSAFVASRAVRSIVALDPVRRLISTFFRPPLHDPSRATLVAPILRPEILAAAPSCGEHVLVYVNGTVRADWLASVLAPVDARFLVYGVGPADAPPHVTFRPPSVEGFLHDLASCRAVVSTAGFTLISEALHLGKPVLAVPNRGIYEQALNAAYLERQGRGRAVFGTLLPDDVRRFLAEADALAGPPGGADGLADALDGIEEALAG